MADRRKSLGGGKDGKASAPPRLQQPFRPAGITSLNLVDIKDKAKVPPKKSRSRQLDDKALSKMDVATASKRMQRWQRQDQGHGVSLGFFDEARLTGQSLVKNIFGAKGEDPPWLKSGKDMVRKPFWKKEPPPSLKRAASSKRSLGSSKKSSSQKSLKKKSKRDPTKSKKKKEEVKEEPKKVPLKDVEVPTTVWGLLTLNLRSNVQEVKDYFQSRAEYARRKRQVSGPGTSEIIVMDIILKPLFVVWGEINYYIAAYTRVDDAFNVQKARLKRKRGQLIDVEELECVTWHTLEALKERMVTIVGTLTVASLLLGVAINEFNFRGFIPSYDMDCANPAADINTCFNNPCIYHTLQAGTPSEFLELECPNLAVVEDPVFQALKIVGSVITLVLLISIYYLHRYDANILSLRNHVEFSDKVLERSSLYRAGLLPQFVTEVLLCCVHQLPYLQFDFVVDTLIFSDLPSVYTSDSAMGTFLFLRVYHLWRWFKQGVFRHYDSRAYAIRLTEEPMSHLLAIKILVLESPIALLSGTFILALLTSSYVYRVVESSQNFTMSVYYWDALWFSADTITGLSFADPRVYPRSVLGRVVAVIARLMGLFWTSLLISTLRFQLKFGSWEVHLLRWLELSRMSDLRKTSAARCIQYMWLYGLDHWSTTRQLERFRIASGKLRLFSASHRLPETSNFEMFVQSAIASNNQVSDLIEKQAESLQLAMKNVKVPKAAKKVLTVRHGDNTLREKGVKTARFESEEMLSAAAGIEASGHNFGSPGKAAVVGGGGGGRPRHVMLPGEIEEVSEEQAGGRGDRRGRMAMPRYRSVAASHRAAGAVGGSVRGRAWVSGGRFGLDSVGGSKLSARRPGSARESARGRSREDRSRPPSSRGGRGTSAERTRPESGRKQRPRQGSISSQASMEDVESVEGSDEVGQLPASRSRSGRRRSSIYAQESLKHSSNESAEKQPQTYMPFSKALAPAFKRSGSFVRTVQTSKSLATQAISEQRLLSQALFQDTEDDQYKLVMNRKEQDLMKAKEVKKQAEDASAAMEHLRASNDNLLLTLGYKPDRAKMWYEVDDAKMQEQWEKDWDVRLQVVEKQLKKLDENLMSTMGQIMLLVQGLYAVRRAKKKKGGTEEGGESPFDAVEGSPVP